MAGLALLAIVTAPGPVFAQAPPVPTSVNPSVVTKGTCPAECAVNVTATNVGGPAVRCKFTQRNPPHQVLVDIPPSYSPTNVRCRIFEPERAGLYDLTLTNDGATYSSASVELTVECPPGRFGDECRTCFCQEPEFCNDGWDGDGFCSECPDGSCDPACVSSCQCNGSPCEMGTLEEPESFCTPCICNDGRYGAACESTCPGGEGASQCSGNGLCDDGVNGTGECSCTNEQFWGSACENTCSTNCVDSRCRQSDGVCLACPPGWTGDLCDELICFCDFNGDGRIDLQDFHVFAGCFGGPGVIPSPPSPASSQQCLDAFDVDTDSDVDLFDMAGFFLVFTGS